MTNTAAFKDLGNEHFKAGNIAEHSRSDPKVFGNRALTRIKLSDWAGAENDARKAIELYGPQNKSNVAMKAHFNLAQALLPQRHVGEALDEAKLAYSICIEIQDPSADVIGNFILRAKQAKWQARETARLRELNETLALVEDLLDAQLQRDRDVVYMRFRNGGIGSTGRKEEVEELENEAELRRASIRRGFEDSKKPESAERVVPDWLIDPITFEVMHDPIVTPTGVSYERVSLLKHIRASGCDPLTRQPLKADMLIPNVALKNACSEFLDKNGWAADW